MNEFPGAPVVRVRHAKRTPSENPWRSCSGTVLGTHHVVVPLGLFASFEEAEVTAAGDRTLEIQCACRAWDTWKRAFVYDVIPLWRSCEEFQKLLSPDAVAASVTIGSTVFEGQSNPSALTTICGTLVVLQIQGGLPHEIAVKSFEQEELVVGEIVDVYGCPFPSLLGRKCMSSRFRAFVSCILYGNTTSYSGPTLYLLDAQGCVPGTEGGSIVKNNGMALCGCLGYAISSPSIGASFHVAWPLQFIAHVLCTSGGSLNEIGVPQYKIRVQEKHAARVSTISALTVSVHIGDGSIWASGFLLRPTVVVTNAHALDGASDTETITVQCHRGRKHMAYVKHSLDKDTMDLAFLDVPSLESPSQWREISHTHPVKGKSIVLSGFPLWNPRLHCCSPKLTSGIVTGTLHDKDDIAVFMTDAHVINGASGGPILDISPEGISFVGLACSNARITRVDHHGNEKRSIIFPTLNFCIPSQCVSTAYDIIYRDTGDTIHTSTTEQRLRKAFQSTTQVWKNISACSDVPTSKL